MSVPPISTARVSDPLRNERLQRQLQSDLKALQKTYDQLSTGLRLTRISEDPAAAGRAITMQRGISRAEQAGRNAGVVEGFYAATDSSLANISSALIEARGLTVHAAQNVLGASEREGVAATVGETIKSIVQTVNVMFRDHHLLGGHLQSELPLKFNEAGVVFSGADTVAKTHAGGGIPVAVGVAGTEVLGLAGPITSPSSLSAGLAGTTPLADLAGGRGVTPGIIRLSDGGDWQQVDLRNASDVDDVVALLESLDLDGRSLEVTLAPDGFTIAYADGLGGTLAIDDVAGGRTARDLGIRNMAAQAPSPVVATDLAPRITLNTPLGHLHQGAGIDTAAGLQIREGEQTFVVDTSQAQTVGDVLVAINRSGANVRAEIDSAGTGIRVRGLASGVDYSIGENGGTVAADLGIRTADADTRLSELDRGFGPFLNETGPDLIIRRTDGSELELDLEGLETVADVIDLINNHPDNQDVLQVIASLNTHGNGITLTAAEDTEPLTVRNGGSSNAGNVLGLIPPGADEAAAAADSGEMRLVGEDFRPREPGGTLDTLLRLERAIRAEDLRDIERMQKRLDGDMDAAFQARSKIGLWTQTVTRLRNASEEEVLALRSLLSDEIDADIPAVISEMSLRQTSQEASLKVIGQTARLSLLDFL